MNPKKIKNYLTLLLLLLFCFNDLSAQYSCVESLHSCGFESMTSDLDLFEPTASEDAKIIKLRFVFPQRFGDEANNIGGWHIGPEDGDPSNDNYHRTIWNHVVNSMNWRLANFNNQPSAGVCGGAGSLDSKIQFDVEMVNYEDIDDFFWNNDNADLSVHPDTGLPLSGNGDGDPCSSFDQCAPDDLSEWFIQPLLETLDNTLGKRMNIVMNSTENVYVNALAGNFIGGCGYYCSMHPEQDCDDYQGQANYNSDTYAKFLSSKDLAATSTDPDHYWCEPCFETAPNIACNPDPCYAAGGSSDWMNNRYRWFTGSIGRWLTHEIFHNFTLPHTNNGSQWPFTETSCNMMCNGCENGSYINIEQIKRIHKALAMTEAKEFVEGCISDDPAKEFTADYTIDYDFTSYGDIIVKSGTTLTLTCALRMPEGARIHVERGAKFIVDGGYITNSCPDERWGGIDVWGNSSVSHGSLVNNTGTGPITFNTQAVSDPGILHILNGAVIENGPNGTISNYRHGYGNTYFGGIIVAEGSSFYNNKRTAAFLKYDFPEESIFRDCVFEVNDNYDESYTQLTFWENEGVRITNCDFRVMWTDAERASFPVSYGSEPKGIGSIDASYFVEGCTFTNFNMGIRVEDTSPNPSNIAILGDGDDSTLEFDGCFYGIGTQNLASATISDCNFDPKVNGTSSNYHEYAYGATLRGEGANYVINNNHLINSDDIDYCFGIHLHNSNECDALIEENYAEGWSSSLDFHNKNGNTIFKCNDLTSKEYDVHLYGTSSNYAEVFVNQGSSSQPAGNLFSDVSCTVSASDEHIRTNAYANSFNYYHKSDFRHDPICSPSIVFDFAASSGALSGCEGEDSGDGGDGGGGIPPSGGCPGFTTHPGIGISVYDFPVIHGGPHPGTISGGITGTPINTGGVKGGIKGGVKYEGVKGNRVRFEVTDYSPWTSRECYQHGLNGTFTATSVLDHGNSPEIFEVVKNEPIKHTTLWSLRGASPYLSDGLLLEVIHSNMTPINKGIVLLDNAPLSDELMLAAHNKIPDAIYKKLYVVKQNVKESERSRLERSIKELNLKLVRTLNLLLEEAREQGDYTEGLELLGLDGTNYSKKRAIGWMSYFGKTAELKQTIGTIEDIGEEMKEFYKIQQIVEEIKQIKYGEIEGKEISFESELFLHDASSDESSFNQQYACVALSILNGTACDMHNHSHDEDEMHKRSGDFDIPMPNQGSGKLVECYPNPSDGTFNIGLTDGNYNDEITLQLTDINGKLIDTRTMRGDVQTYNFDSNVNNGIYVLNVFVNGVSLHNEKIVLVR